MLLAGCVDMNSSGALPPDALASSTRIENLVNQWQKTLPLYNQAQVEGISPDCGPNPRAVVNIEPAEEKG